MLPLFLFIVAIVVSIVHLLITRRRDEILEIFFSYFIFFNIGIMGILGFFAHTFLADETARQIGWGLGSPFQSEIAVANLTFGILGILSLWIRGSFWIATVLGASIFLLGAFVVHLIQYFVHGNAAPLNIGLSIWLEDLIFPLLYLGLLGYYMCRHCPHYFSCKNKEHSEK